jgi:uncharacterized protein (TIGR02217 family)
MAFHNVQLNPDISYGAQGGPSFGTTVQTTASGHEYRVTRQSRPRRRYQFDKLLMDPADWGSLIDFWVARRGHLHGFRFKDWSDFTTATDGVSSPTNLDQVIGSGDGLETQFQLAKTYDVGGLNPLNEAIRLPVAGTLLVAVAGVATTSYTVTNPGGLITFSSAPSLGAVVSVGFEFDRSVRFNQNDEVLNIRLERGYLANAAGLSCIEQLDEEQTPELWYPGGSSGVVTTNQDIVLSYDVELWTVQNIVVGTKNVFLPPPDKVVGGPRLFVISCLAASSGNLQVRDDSGVPVGSALTPGTTKRVALNWTGSTATWILY